MDVLDICARQWAQCVRAAREGLGTLPQERVFELRYEDLVADETALAQLVAFVGIGQPERVLERYRQTVRRSDSGKWRRTLTGEQQDRMNGELTPLLTDLGYT